MVEDKIEVKKSTIKRIGGILHRVVPIADKSGDVISYALKPLMVEFKTRDVIQVIVGSALLAIPVSLTEEAWNLGRDLPLLNICIIGFLSIILISVFVYFNFYRNIFKQHKFNFVKRTISTYILSFLVVAGILTIIDKCPWQLDTMLAIKRVVIVTFPASLSGTLSDMIK